MKTIFLVSILAFFATSSYTQTKGLNLTNALVVSKVNDQEDRFSMEVAIAELLTQAKIKNAVSLNIIKQGGDAQIIAGDSITKLLAGKGINTVLLVSIRGYDKKFKSSNSQITLVEDLAADNLFRLYQDDITSVTIEFHFFRDGKMVGSDLVKIPGVSTREAVLKKLRKKVGKKIEKDWI